MNPSSPSERIQTLAPDLNRTSPRSPYAALDPEIPACAARLVDKCRAELAGTIGEYHYNCPLDRKFFDAAGLDAEELRAFIATGAEDAEVAQWMKTRMRQPGDKFLRWSRRFRANPVWHLLEFEDWLHRRRHGSRP